MVQYRLSLGTVLPRLDTRRRAETINLCLAEIRIFISNERPKVLSGMNVMAIARKLPSGSHIPYYRKRISYIRSIGSRKHGPGITANSDFGERSADSQDTVTEIEAEPARCKYTLWDGLRQVFRDMTDRAKGVNDRTYVNPDACVDES
ncbi:hypothetical protein V6N13_115673 [Hibiscus sabdariffa]